MDDKTTPQQQEASREIVGWRCTSDGKHFAEFKEKRCRYCVPVYAKNTSVCPACGIIDQEPFGPDGHHLGEGCPHSKHG